MISDLALHLLRTAASASERISIDADVLLQLLDAYDEARELSSATNWFDPRTHFGKWKDEDLFMASGDPLASHWLLQGDIPTVRADALCEYCGHTPEEHMYSSYKKDT